MESKRVIALSLLLTLNAFIANWRSAISGVVQQGEERWYGLVAKHPQGSGESVISVLYQRLHQRRDRPLIFAAAEGMGGTMAHLYIRIPQGRHQPINRWGIVFVAHGPGGLCPLVAGAVCERFSEIAAYLVVGKALHGKDNTATNIVLTNRVEKKIPITAPEPGGRLSSLGRLRPHPVHSGRDRSEPR